MKSIYKYFLLLIIIISLCTTVTAQVADSTVKLIAGNTGSAESIRLIKIHENLYSITIRIDELILRKKNSPYGYFYQLQTPSATFLGNTEGKPALPSFAKLIEIPENSSFKVQIDSLISDTFSLNSYEGFKIYPFQASERKNSVHSGVFRYDTASYLINSLAGDSLVKLEPLGIMRGRNLERLVIKPVSYNPVKNTLRVVKYFSGLVEIQPPYAFASNPSKFSSVAFSKMMNSKFSVTSQATPIPSKHPMKYLILADSMFKKSLKPFVRWKTEEGYKVVIVYKGAPGVGTTPQQMKAYLTAVYNSATADDPAPTYLLIVGDNEQLPAFTSPRYGHATDLYYSTFDGPDDHFPDMFYGRFSATNDSNLTSQVSKTIEYEKYLFPDPSFLDSAMLISTGNDGNGYDYGNGQINYIANNYANPAHGIHSNTFLWPNSYYRSPDVQLHMNNGCAFVNYTGHGSTESWLSPSFTTSQIYNLKNYHKYPLVISNGCITNYFTIPVCFGEALLRGRNVGAIGHIGCTNDSYWDEDYFWAVGVRPIVPNPAYSSSGLGAFDRIFHTHNEPQSEWYPAQGQMTFAGDLAVEESLSNLNLYYWEIYTLLGDPSLKVYYGRPDSLKATIPDRLPVGSTQVGIYAEPGSYSGLSLRDTLLDGGAVDSSGFILLSFPSTKNTDTLMLVISKQNRKPILAKMPAYSPALSYLEFKGFSINSESKSADNKADYGESIKLNVQFKNMGGRISKNIKILLSCADSLASVMDSIVLCKSIPTGKDTTFINAFSLYISPYVQDQHEISLRIDASDSLNNPYRFYINLIAAAPILVTGEPSYNDKFTGNGNARPDPGETLSLVVPVTNTGHSTMDPALFKISGKNSILTIQDTLIHLPSIMPDSTVWLNLPFHLDASAIPGAPLNIRLKLDTFSIHISDNIIIRPAAYSEDFETGNLKQLPWTSSTALNWFTSGTSPLDGNFSARSGKIGSNQTTDMQIMLFVTDTGRIQFDYKVSSEEFYDFFNFYIDGTMLIHASGLSKVLSFNDTISVGWHSFVWRYMKDLYTSAGNDCAWVDNIMFPPSVIIPSSVTHPYYDGVIARILNPSADTNSGAAIHPTVVIRNRGTLPIEPGKISYQFNSLPVVTENLHVYLSPGDSLIYTFNTLLDLPENQACSLTAFLFTPGDSIHSNDTATVNFTNIYNQSTIYPIADELHLYPNPASDFIYYKLPPGVYSGKVGIYDIKGRILYDAEFSSKPGNKESRIELKNLPSGTFLLSITSDGKKYLQKFVKR